MQQYDPSGVTLIFGGALITGYAPDSIVKVEWNTPRFALLVGADGEAARSRSRNESARITVRVMPGSTGAMILEAAVIADKAGGAGVLPLLLTDLSTGRSHASEGAWVVNDPDIDYQQEVEPIEFMIETDRLIATPALPQ